MPRLTEFGSPFKNLNSGRNETADGENTDRLQRAYRNYLASECIVWVCTQRVNSMLNPLKNLPSPRHGRN